jgi:glycosyltransferase involved in cell wall biosynthesis
MRNLPEFDFEVIALVPTDREPSRWPPPPNLVSLRRIGVWDRVADRLQRRSRDGVPRAVRSFIWFLLGPPVADLRTELDLFAVQLDGLLELARSDALIPALKFETIYSTVAEALEAAAHANARFQVTLADGIDLANALGHLLSPLAIDAGPVDVLHASANGLPAMVGMAAAARRGTPFLMSEHGLYLRERYMAADSELPRPVVRSALLRFYRLICATAFRRAELITPASDFNRRWALALGAEPAKVQTLHNGVDLASFPARTAEVAEPHVVWLGRIDPIKDLHTLIRAAALVAREIPDVRFRLFGEEPAAAAGYLASCRELVAELGVDDVVRFEGRVDKPVHAFHAGQITLLTSISEGFPYTVLESRSSGVPVIGTAVGGVPEAIADTGAVVPPGDPQALAEACIRMLRSGDQRRRLGVAARERVERLFSLDRMLDAHDLVYRRLSGTEPWVDLREPAVVLEWPGAARAAASS